MATTLVGSAWTRDGHASAMLVRYKPTSGNAKVRSLNCQNPRDDPGQQTTSGEPVPPRGTRSIRTVAKTNGEWRIISHFIMDTRQSARVADDTPDQ